MYQIHKGFHLSSQFNKDNIDFYVDGVLMFSEPLETDGESLMPYIHKRMNYYATLYRNTALRYKRGGTHKKD